MIDLATPEIWLVCGSQHLYGPGPLQQVAAHAREIAGALASSRSCRSRRHSRPLLTTPDEIAKLCLEANSDPELRRPDPLDAHVLAVEDVDPRAERAAEAVRASPHPVQPRPALGHDRHGLHEPQPVGAWRPRGGLHSHAHAARPQGRRRPLVRPGGAGPDRRLDARGAGLARLAGREILPLRRQHAPGRGHRGRQGRGRNEVRLRHQRLWRRRPRRAWSTPSPDAKVEGAGERIRGALRGRAGAAQGGARHESLLYGSRLELACAPSSSEGGFKGFTDTFEDLHGLQAAARASRRSG